MKKLEIPIGELILIKLKEEKRSVAWLAEKICIDPSSLRKRLKKNSMNIELLRSISKALNYSFLQICDINNDKEASVSQAK